MKARIRFPAALAALGLPVALLAALAGFFSQQSPVRAQEAKTSALSVLDALPAETTVVLRLKNAADLRERWKASPLHALREHPDIKRFLDDVRKKMDEGLSDARGKLGFDPMELVDLVQGEVVLAIGGLDKIASALAAEFSGGQSDVTPGDLPFLMTLDAGTRADALRERIGKIFEFAQKDGAKKEVEDFRGGKLTTITNFNKDKKDGKDAKDGEKKDLEKLYFGDLGSRVFMSINRPFLEKTMANLSGGGADALSKNSDFADTLKEVKGDSDLLFFLNLKPIMDTIRKHIQVNPIASMVWGLIEGKLLGRSLKNLGVTMSLRESSIDNYSFINNGGGTDGILGILQGPTLPGKPNALIPDDADYFVSLALNVPRFYEFIRDVANQVLSFQMMMGGGGQQQGEMPNFEQVLEAQFGIKIKPVVEALGSGVHFYQRGAGAGPENPLGAVTVALELKDEMPIKELMGKLAAMASLVPQKYLDRDLYVMGFGGPGGPDGNAPAVGIADKLLVIGAKTDSVKEVIRRAGKGGKSVVENPAYQSLGARVPREVSSLSYSSPRSYQDMFKQLKDAMGKEEDFPLPDLSALGDVMAGSIGYSIWKPQGMYGESILLLKKGRGAPASDKAEKPEKKEPEKKEKAEK